MWIEDFRIKNGLELDEFTRRVNMHARKVNPPLESGVSDTLIHMLERQKNAVTHPRIANIIADVCGATAEQRDMIVAEIHRGQWNPVVTKPNFNDLKLHGQNGSKAVVKIDRRGNAVDYYESVVDAARRTPQTEKMIRDRCKRRVPNEFTYMVPYTFRYAAEWDIMTAAQRQEDISQKGVD